MIDFMRKKALARRRSVSMMGEKDIVATNIVGGNSAVGREGGGNDSERGRLEKLKKESVGAIKKTERKKGEKVGGAKGRKFKVALAAPDAQMCIKSALRKAWKKSLLSLIMVSR